MRTVLVFVCLLSYVSGREIEINEIIVEHIHDLLREMVISSKPEQKSAGFVGQEKILCILQLSKYATCKAICMRMSMSSMMQCTSIMFARFLKSCFTGNLECFVDPVTNSLPDQSAVKCGIENPYPTRIVNGEPVNDPRKYSWQVGISPNDSPNYSVVCGGSIITNKHILTAAHCFSNSQTYFIGFGSNSQANTNIIIPQANVFIHKDYKFPDYDIAIIELSQQIDLVKHGISPICIPKDDTKDYTGLHATVSGWGSTVGNNPTPTPPPEPQFPNILQEAQIPVLINAKCQEKYSEFTERMLCAGDMKGFENGGKDSCQGDSGGPLTVQENGQYQQIGIVSFGDGCASKGYPGVYARVTEFLNWINEQVEPEKIYKSS